LRLRGANRTAGTRGDGELHVIGETVNEMLDHVSASRFRVIRTKLVARSPPMKSFSPGAQHRRHSKAIYAKHSKEVTKDSNYVFECAGNNEQLLISYVRTLFEALLPT
jgi:hypothetical protein